MRTAFLSLLPLLVLPLAVRAADTPDAKGVEFFERKIRPVLVEQCYKCHSAAANKSKGGLAVDTRAGLHEGGENGPAVVPGEPAKGTLLKALRHDGPVKMPNEQKKLPDAVLADFEAWVRMGAPDPRDGKSSAKKGIDFAEARNHWAHKPVAPAPAPTVKNVTWPAGDIDRHVLAAIAAKGLAPAADAANGAWLRRVTFDLTGLPPSPDELAAFLKDATPDATANVVDRLLASPRFGEHWARHWLDGVRFDPTVATTDRYRDWVVLALNSDMPYDQFIRYQLAGDLLPKSGDEKVLADETRGADPAPKKPHHPPKAKSLIFLNMMGGPTQFETFDFKPEMAKFDGKAPPLSKQQEGTVRFNPGSTITAPLFKYLRSKTSEVATTEVFPRMAGVLDELCVIRSMVADSPASPSGQQQAMTGYARQPMPSLGSWLLYGLGTANTNLPGFVYLAEGGHHGSGFLPGDTQGMPVGAKVPNIRRPATTTDAAQREHLDLLGTLNRGFADRNPGTDPLAARIDAAELAFRMQMSCPEATDLSKESRETLDLYGLGGGKPAPGRPGARALSYTAHDFATMCLTARRLVERGVRVVTICVGGRRGWDQHGNLKASVEHNAGVIDRGMAALLADLKRTGLLDSTLVMWGGEFGRTPYAQGKDGRDHFAKGFTYWLAGGGAKRGVYYGETDEVGMTVTKNPVHIHDLHATLLHLMGLDPEKLTFKYGGRDQRLTDVSGKVVNGLIA